MIADDFESFEKRKVMSKLDLLFNSNNKDMLSEVASFMKLNYNCPDSEKVGTGEGSCSNGKMVSNEFNNLPHGMKVIEESSGNRLSLISAEGKVLMSVGKDNSTRILKEIKRLTKYYDRNTKTARTKPAIVSEISKPVISPNEIPKSSSLKSAKMTEVIKTSVIDKDTISMKIKTETGKVFDIILPSGNEKAGNDLAGKLSNMPAILRNSPVSTITLSNQPDPENQKMAAKYGRNFTSAAQHDSNSRHIIFFGTGNAVRVNESVLAHELAHSVDANFIHSTSREYINAIQEDLKLGKSFVSSYAKDSYEVYSKTPKQRRMKYCEDFADGLEEMTKNEAKFEKQFPNRAKYFRSIK